MYHACFFVSLLNFFKRKIEIIWAFHVTTLKRDFLTKLIRFFLKNLSYYVPQKIIYCSNKGKNFTNFRFC